ncbi:LysM peptidoglycan-binding domain-containing M23 family metallopeptidase [Streptomyces sp. CAU 1734]|uniref:LysM peptidoglycan-binding domain-containing M23 family metallopeptidase n=1 Tax=Streptomyces sp. CAU 1734 TaxID=3140360 RepID=UPI003260B084
MPAKGKHRRPKAGTITRGLVVASTGGAAIALPLLGATGAQAAEPAAAPAAVTAPAAAVAEQRSPAAAPAGKSEAGTYRVVAGDHLSGIAEDHGVTGGWKQLYQDNRAAVGGNPSLIHPGLELSIGSAAAAGTPDAERSSRDGSRDASRNAGANEKPAAPAAPAAARETSAPAADPVTEAPAPEPAAEAPAEPEPAAPASGYTAPIAGAGVTTSYRVSGAMWSSGYHTGIDFAVPTGTSVKSVGPGTVVSAGWSGAYGNEVVIQHTDGKYSQYAHLSSLAVSAGQSVSGGQEIGLAGSTGNSSGPHLHFEIRTGSGYGTDIDPLAYLRGHGVSL